MSGGWQYAGGVLFLVLLAGCSGMTAVTESPASAGAQAEPAAVPAFPAEPPRSEAKEEAIVPEPVIAAAVPEPESVPVAAPVAVPAPVPVSATPALRAAVAAEGKAPVAAARTVAPSLDIAALTARLRETRAIGAFTKLALKNQMDDLLAKFRAHHLGALKAGVASLRQPYDMLILKVLALLQDGDPSLARSISGSREAIWGILADPEKFKAAS